MRHAGVMDGGRIELDVSPRWAPQTLQVERPVRGRQRLRWPPLLMLPLLVLVAVSASAPVPHWEPVLAADIAGASMLLGVDDTAFVFLGQGDRAVTAYRPGRDTPLWSIDGGAAGVLVPNLTGDPGLVALDAYRSNAGSGSAGSVQMRDARTGQLLWEREGVTVFAVAGDLVVLTDRSGLVESTTPPAGLVEAVDLRTGRPRWTRPLATGTLLGTQYLSPGGGWVGVELQPDGLLRLADLATDAQRRTVQLALLGAPSGVMVRGDVAVVWQRRALAEGYTTVAYDLDTGAERWRFDDLRTAWPCGSRYLCAFGANVTTVVDPDAGATVYRGPGDQLTFHGDTLLVWRRSQRGGIGVDAALYDLGTGRRVRSYGKWRIVADDPDRGVLAAQVDSGGRFVLARLDLETGTATVVGTADDWLGDPSCQWGSRHLACAGGGGMRIWRLH
jgi:outer membrane protein assembly factor BamB